MGLHSPGGDGLDGLFHNAALEVRPSLVSWGARAMSCVFFFESCSFLITYRAAQIHLVQHLVAPPQPSFLNDRHVLYTILGERESRAVLILNRFTRALTIMFATDSVIAVLGVPAIRLSDKSFYNYIREDSYVETMCRHCHIEGITEEGLESCFAWDIIILVCAA